MLHFSSLLTKSFRCSTRGSMLLFLYDFNRLIELISSDSMSMFSSTKEIRKSWRSWSLISSQTFSSFSSLSRQFRNFSCMAESTSLTDNKALKPCRLKRAKSDTLMYGYSLKEFREEICWGFIPYFLHIAA